MPEWGETPIPIPPGELDSQCERERAKVVVPLTPEEQGIYFPSSWAASCPTPRVARVIVYLNYEALREGGRADAGIDPGVFELRLNGKPLDTKPKVRLSSNSPPTWAQLVYPLGRALKETEPRPGGYYQLSLHFPDESGGRRSRAWEFQILC